jgi:hypothetical protein
MQQNVRLQFLPQKDLHTKAFRLKHAETLISFFALDRCDIALTNARTHSEEQRVKVTRGP